MKAVRELKRELPSLQKRGQVELRDITFIFLKVRQIMENKSSYKASFPELNLFCNWCAHTRLSKSNTIYYLLYEVSKAVSRATNVPSGSDPGDMTNVFCQVAGDILSIPKFRLQLKQVLEDQKIDAFITTSKEWWDAIVALLFLEISDKPIEFPNNVIEGQDKKSKAGRIFQSILLLPNSNDHDKIIRLNVKHEKECPLLDGKDGFVFQFTALSGVHFVVAARGKEEGEAFSS